MGARENIFHIFRTFVHSEIINDSKIRNNKISNLWSIKPDAAEPASRKEPAIGEAQTSVSILDLSRSDVVHSDVNDTDKAKLEVSDDELDIPAFLRRQAN